MFAGKERRVSGSKGYGSALLLLLLSRETRSDHRPHSHPVRVQDVAPAKGVVGRRRNVGVDVALRGAVSNLVQVHNAARRVLPDQVAHQVAADEAQPAGDEN